METLEIGNCYYSAYNNMGGKYPILVHGIVTGTKGKLEGLEYGHAWLEFERDGIEWCYDSETDKEFPKVLFYRVGNVEYTKKYTPMEAVVESLKFGHYGPWDKKIFDVDDETLKLLRA